MSGLDLPVLVLLALFGLAGGIGITALGPGGVLPTIGLFSLTSLAPAEVAGTAIVTHITAGLLASAAFVRSGELRAPGVRRTVGVLAVAALVGTPLGVFVNTTISSRTFGTLLGILVMLVAVLVWYREYRTPGSERTEPLPLTVLAGVGLVVSVASGILGLGGPMLTVPLLIALRLPVLDALAAAQVQSVVIASVGTLGYLGHGSIDWGLAAIVGVPELAGVLIGWVIARALPTRALKNALVVALILVGPYLALHG